ncbi:ArsR/SmtB family transcription factor [Halomarina oriensis]|uniref:Metalloregulator ArsR/SmtB family transcription factor n=1 Tax=Halomarina oriensis TaxID=671145 RepID=A0A6B0GNX4_9EURY|nr:metalloregulator ArsR/SmtB family transcription factor [Halomarina oriensis]MWG35219.1 metalloregulator ArsR/SmtB family transcription factor [Halomarina oriensis]
MSQSNTRLRRYLEDDLGECCDEDVEQRLAELAAFDLGDDDRVGANVAALSALANDTRYRLVSAFHAADGELCVCELLPLVDVSESAVSHALSTLTEAGIVTKRKDGKWRMYRITPRGTALLVALDGTRAR